jgi:hypothetical protein
MPSFDRASAADLMQAATGDGRAAGHIGALLVLDATPAFSVAEARRLLGERIRTVPRLRQRLCRAPPGCGRPYWTDDPAFDIGQHVRQVRCPPPGDERALLDLAAAQLGEPMPRSRPLWSVTFVTDLAGGGTGLLVITDHVLADGIAGLAVLGALADQAESAHIGADRFPAPAPRARELAADAWRGRLRRTAPAAGDIAQPAGRAAAAARRYRCRPGRDPRPGTCVRRHRQRRAARGGRRGAANLAGRARRATQPGHHHGPGGGAAHGQRRRARQPDRNHAGHRARRRPPQRPDIPDS